MALAYALSDEIHQELAPGRGFELADIGYDLVGIITALGLIWVRERGRGAEERDLQALPTEGREAAIVKTGDRAADRLGD